MKHKNNRKDPRSTRKHTVMPDVEIKRIKEPRPTCSICGQPIELIVEAVSEPDGGYSHFDCIVDKLKEKYGVKEPDVVSYIGQGCFAVCSRDDEGKFFIKERISYESSEAFTRMKKFVEETKE